MISFSQDKDILKYEPVLFSELYFSDQILISGTGATVSGTSLTKAGEDFVSAGVKAGQVVYLKDTAGSLDGCFEIVEVVSETELTVSVLRAYGDDDIVEPLPGSNVDYCVCTFEPQSREVMFELTQYFGIGPGDAASEYSTDDILDTDVLRSVSVFAVIACIYATLASDKEDLEGYWEKSFYYKTLFEKARERCIIDIDAGGDGESDIRRICSSGKLLRD